MTVKKIGGVEEGEAGKRERENSNSKTLILRDSSVRETERGREREGGREGGRKRQTDRQTDRQTETERKREF